MNVVQCITRGDVFDGAQVHVLSLCELLRKNGHKVVAVVGTEGKLTDRFSNLDIPFRVVPSLRRSIQPIRDVFCVSRLRKLFRSINPDLVATHCSKAGILGRLAAYKENIGSVYTAHGWAFDDAIPFISRKAYLAVERYVARRTNQIIVVADHGRHLALRHQLLAANRVKTIYCGVNDLGGSFEKRHSNEFTITMVAGFRKQKSHETLIAALSNLRERPWVLNLLGEGETMSTVRDQVQNCGIANRVRFAGFVNNVSEYLKQTDLKVLTTNWEGLPISVVEALSFGLPVVASNVSGNSEVVIDGYNGILTERDNVDSVTKALSTMMNRVDLRKLYGRNSRKLFEERFTLRQMYEKTIAVYEQVANESNQDS